MLTENPFSDHHHSSTMKSSIPQEAHKEETLSTHSQNSTVWNESILGPLKRRTKDQRKKDFTSFERMMSSFEDEETTKSAVDIEDVIVGLDVVQNSKFKVRPKQHVSKKQDTRWKDFVSGRKLEAKMVCTYSHI